MSTDPAVDAADRARYDEDGFGVMYSSSRDAMEEAAREALKPVKALHRAGWTGSPRELLCSECMDAWPCATAELVYTAEELGEEQ